MTVRFFASEEIPGTLEEIFGVGDPDEPEEWKESLIEASVNFATTTLALFNSLDVPPSVVSLLDASYTTLEIVQIGADALMESWIVIGDYVFDDIRDELEEEFEEADEYRDFEVWGGREIALLEDRGAIIFGKELVEGVLGGVVKIV